MNRHPLLVLAAALSACGSPSASNEQAAAPAAPAPKATLPPVEPAAPVTPAGLPDDRTPVSEAPFAEDSAQGAANAVQTYFALAEAGKSDAARRLWRSGADADAFARDFASGTEHHAQVGAPGEPEGAAGSIYVEVPVQLYGRKAGGEAFRTAATVTLRRVNDVPGSSAEQRRWHIERIVARS